MMSDDVLVAIKDTDPVVMKDLKDVCAGIVIDEDADRLAALCENSGLCVELDVVKLKG